MYHLLLTRLTLTVTVRLPDALLSGPHLAPRQPFPLTFTLARLRFRRDETTLKSRTRMLMRRSLLNAERHRF